MRKTFFTTMLISSMLIACNNSQQQTTNENMKQEFELTQEWDKVFPREHETGIGTDAGVG